jgi:enamine deaminase RidA (YjgF/YER057c/UK114 family)
MSTPPIRSSVDSGTHWEALAGYARAVRVGDCILVSGTTATGPDGVVGAGDVAAQARYIIDKIEAAIAQLGGSLHDIVRTRVYVRNIADWEPVARVHGERFGGIRPANTLVQAALVGEEYLVEIEAEAVIGAGDAL